MKKTLLILSTLFLLCSCSVLETAQKDKLNCISLGLFPSPTTNGVGDPRYICKTLYEHCSDQVRSAVQDLNDTWGSRDNNDTPSQSVDKMIDKCISYEKTQ